MRCLALKEINKQPGPLFGAKGKSITGTGKTVGRRWNKPQPAAGELLVQFNLLKYGIDSARMTTDSGIDLVAYSPKDRRAYTIQVKTKEKPTGAGGTGKKALGWFLSDSTPAQLIALVDLESENVWLFEIQDFRKKAQQKSGKNIMQLYMYTEEPRKTKHEYSKVSDFHEYLIDNQIHKLIPQ